MLTETTNIRSLSRDARHERRVQVVRLRKADQTCDEIAVQTQLSRAGVFDLCKRLGLSVISAVTNNGPQICPSVSYFFFASSLMLSVWLGSLQQGHAI